MAMPSSTLRSLMVRSIHNGEDAWVFSDNVRCPYPDDIPRGIWWNGFPEVNTHKVVDVGEFVKAGTGRDELVKYFVGLYCEHRKSVIARVRELIEHYEADLRKWET